VLGGLTMRVTMRVTWVHIIAAYVVAIAGFAGVYTWLAHDFYHPYVKYEPDIRELRYQVQQALAESIDKQLGAKPDLGDGVQFQLAIGVGIQGEQEGALAGSVEMGATLKRGDEQQLFMTRLPILISWSGLRTSEKPNAPRTMIENAEQLKERSQTVYIARDPQKLTHDETILTHEPSDQATVTDALGRALERIDLSDNEQHGLFVIQNAEQGFPAFADGKFARMLYFSAITITTVGYGDIVPLTPRGRALAACEATLGIILLGLLVSRFTST
jgi:hypothetical protein